MTNGPEFIGHSFQQLLQHSGRHHLQNDGCCPTILKAITALLNQSTQNPSDKFFRTLVHIHRPADQKQEATPIGLTKPSPPAYACLKMRRQSVTQQLIPWSHYIPDVICFSIFPSRYHAPPWHVTFASMAGSLCMTTSVYDYLDR